MLMDRAEIDDYETSYLINEYVAALTFRGNGYTGCSTYSSTSTIVRWGNSNTVVHTMIKSTDSTWTGTYQTIPTVW